VLQPARYDALIGEFGQSAHGRLMQRRASLHSIMKERRSDVEESRKAEYDGRGKTRKRKVR
jgi:hypothetical protein